jgi:hypothetical protein
LLLDYGADRNIKDKDYKTPSDVARTDIIRTLIDTYQELPIIKEPDAD